MADRWIVIPRWDEFQHRDMARTNIPPWLKNYTRLLHDDDYLDLSLSQRGILHGIWLMYASHRRVLSETRARTYLTGGRAPELRHWRDNLAALNHAGFIQLTASKPAINSAVKPASLEVEVEIEKNGYGVRTADTWERIGDLIPAHLRPNTETDSQSQDEEIPW